MPVSYGRIAQLGDGATAAKQPVLLMYLPSADLKIFRSTFAPPNFAIMKKTLVMLMLTGAAQFAGAADVVGNPKAAENKVAQCIGCHGIAGYKASFPEVYSVPMIGGQSAKYIENALKAYKKGERKHPTMRGIATSLTEQDMADLAAYYSQKK